jgi:hypothetical protein
LCGGRGPVASSPAASRQPVGKADITRMHPTVQGKRSSVQCSAWPAYAPRKQALHQGNGCCKQQSSKQGHGRVAAGHIVPLQTHGVPPLQLIAANSCNLSYGGPTSNGLFLRQGW